MRMFKYHWYLEGSTGAGDARMRREGTDTRRRVVLRRRDASISRKEDDADTGAFAEDEGVLLCEARFHCRSGGCFCSCLWKMQGGTWHWGAQNTPPTFGVWCVRGQRGLSEGTVWEWVSLRRASFPSIQGGGGRPCRGGCGGRKQSDKSGDAGSSREEGVRLSV